MKKGSYDIQRVKEALPPISELFTRDGHESRRVGSALFVCCPFHTEDSPSCHVDDNSGRFHCFGCGEGGDGFDYWQKSRDLDFRTTLEQLAALVGLGPSTTGTVAPAKKAPAKPKEPEKLADPLTGPRLQQWERATEALATNEEEIARIATWRGIDPECIRFAAERNLMGTFNYFGMPREAFLVERPHQGGLLPISVHVRLGPKTQGNPDKKASWRFEPAGVGSWPFVIGDLATAKHIFLMEGQWDALAITSIMGWHKKSWPDIAVAGLRGATGHSTFLKHELNPKAHIIAIADADGAGARWFKEGGFLDTLHTRVRRVSAFWPTTAKTDFNDLVKAGELDRDLMLGFLLPKMPSKHDKPQGPTFTAWCKDHDSDPDPIGRATKYFLADKDRPKGRRPLKSWERYWRKTGVPPDLFADLGIAYNAYRESYR